GGLDGGGGGQHVGGWRPHRRGRRHAAPALPAHPRRRRRRAGGCRVPATDRERGAPAPRRSLDAGDGARPREHHSRRNTSLAHRRRGGPASLSSADWATSPAPPGRRGNSVARRPPRTPPPLPAARRRGCAARVAAWRDAALPMDLLRALALAGGTMMARLQAAIAACGAAWRSLPWYEGDPTAPEACALRITSVVPTLVAGLWRFERGM